MSRLDIDRIRCLKQMSLEPQEGINLLLGANGQGKTSVLESVAILSDGRSFRTPRNSFLAWEADGARIRGDLESREGERRLEVIFQDGERGFLVDRSSRIALGEYVGLLNYVAFAAGTVELVSGGPVLRRAFLDRGILGLTPAYLEIYRQFLRSLKQRNAALQGDRGDLALWNRSVVEAGLPVWTRRSRYVQHLAPRAARLYGEIAGGRETLEVRYRPSLEPTEDWAGTFLAALERRESVDRRRGRTGLGPHRDELEILLDERSAREYGSRGQQRGVALALKLAEMEIFTEERGEPPILLLDDISSELDRQRTRLLFEYLSGNRQTLVASTDRERLEGLPGVSACFRVEDGSVRLEA